MAIVLEGRSGLHLQAIQELERTHHQAHRQDRQVGHSR